MRWQAAVSSVHNHQSDSHYKRRRFQWTAENACQSSAQSPVGYPLASGAVCQCTPDITAKTQSVCVASPVRLPLATGPGAAWHSHRSISVAGDRLERLPPPPWTPKCHCQTAVDWCNIGRIAADKWAWCHTAFPSQRLEERRRA